MNRIKLEKLSINNMDALYEVCKKCSDYYMLHDGILPNEECVEKIFISLPPDKEYEDKFLLGIYIDNTLIGIVDIVRDFPQKKEWIIGLLLIDPKERGKGIGKLVHKSLVEMVRKLGGNTLRIGVIKENKEGLKFWSSLGYKITETFKREFENKTNETYIMKMYLT